jgi:hypothetical protein
MIGVLRGQRRHANARLAEALSQLRANNVVTLEFFALWVRGVMADFEANHSLAAEQYRELFSLWHETEIGCSPFQALSQPRHFMPTEETARIWQLAAKSLVS